MLTLVFVLTMVAMPAAALLSLVLLWVLPTRGGDSGLPFEKVLLSAYASDGGLFVPEQLPLISRAQLLSWQSHSLAFPPQQRRGVQRADREGRRQQRAAL